jgi:uncharacterized membrane protein
MVWNTLLALVPLGLSVGLFRARWRRRGPLWWSGVVAFLAFLPNAPYVVTDGIHLVRRLEMNPSWVRTGLLMLGFSLFFLAGMEAYALCFVNLRHYLGRTVVPLELAIHGLCAVGIYLGRVVRLNSWDLLSNGDAVLHAARKAVTQPWPAALVAAAFVVTVIGCEALLRVNGLARRAAGWPPGR